MAFKHRASYHVIKVIRKGSIFRDEIADYHFTCRSWGCSDWDVHGITGDKAEQLAKAHDKMNESGGKPGKPDGGVDNPVRHLHTCDNPKCQDAKQGSKKTYVLCFKVNCSGTSAKCGACGSTMS